MNDRFIFNESNPIKKLEYLRPKNPKGKYKVKHPIPNILTIKRQKLEKAAAIFLIDAVVDGYLSTDGNGNVYRVKLENPSINVIMELVDNGTVARHTELKRKTLIVEKEIILKDANDNILNPCDISIDANNNMEHTRNIHISEMRPEEAAEYHKQSLSRENILLANIAKREQEIRNKKR